MENTQKMCIEWNNGPPEHRVFLCLHRLTILFQRRAYCTNSSLHICTLFANSNARDFSRICFGVWWRIWRKGDLRDHDCRSNTLSAVSTIINWILLFFWTYCYWGKDANDPDSSQTKCDNIWIIFRNSQEQRIRHQCKRIKERWLRNYSKYIFFLKKNTIRIVVHNVWHSVINRQVPNKWLWISAFRTAPGKLDNTNKDIESCKELLVSQYTGLYKFLQNVRTD